MDKLFDNDRYPMQITEKEIEYLSDLSSYDREKDIRELNKFLGIVGSWDPMDRGKNPLQFNFFQANDFNYRVNKILHKHLGFDERIAKDFFFRRFQSITNHVEYNLELNTEETIISFDVNLWGSFSIDQLDPAMFKELEDLIDLRAIKRINIDVQSLTGKIFEKLFECTPNVEIIRLHITEPYELPEKIFDITPSIKEINLYKISNLPYKLFRHTTQLTKLSISGDCQIDSLIFKHTPLLQDIFMQSIHGITYNIFLDLNIKNLYLNFCKIKSAPALVKFGGISGIRRLRITRCQLSNTNDVGMIRSIQNNTFIDKFSNKGTFPNLSLLEFWGNSPSSMVYNNLQYFLSTSSREIKIILNLENDLKVSNGLSYSNVKELTILLRNELTTLDNVKIFLALFPELIKLRIEGKSLNNGLIKRNDIDHSELLEICPKLVNHFTQIILSV